jgi:allantoin racemase
MAKAKVLVIVPFALDDEGVANREAQLGEMQMAIGPDIEFRFEPVKASADFWDTYHDSLLEDFVIFEAGLRAQENGYAAVCIDTMSDSGVKALRSVLDIPVIGPARCSYHTALMLGEKFSVITLSESWANLDRRAVREMGLEGFCASVRCTNKVPDLRNLLSGSEEELFPELLRVSLECIADGADVICLGSTTMHAAHIYLAEHLSVPVINPGPLTYKFAEMFLGLGLSQSRATYTKTDAPKIEMVEAMLQAAQSVETGTGR